MQISGKFLFYAQQQASALALMVDNTPYSYQALADSAKILAHYLLSHHVRRVGIITTRTLSSYIAILAASWANITYVPLNPKLTEHGLLQILQQAELDAIILDHSSIPILTPTFLHAAPPLLITPCQPLNTNTLSPKSPPHLIGAEILKDYPPLAIPRWAQPDDLVYIMFTSGTTGIPKGVAVTLSNVNHYLQVMQQRYPLTAEDRVAQFTQLSFDMSVFDLLMAWASGASVHVVPEAQLLAPAKFIQDQQLTVWYSVPSIIGFMHKLKMLKANLFPSLRYSLFAGEALKIDYATWWQQAAPNSLIDNLYGPTELTVTCLAQCFSQQHLITPERNTVAIGQPNPGMIAAIIDEQQHFLAAGTAGELVVSGPQVVLGYWRNPELTAAQFITLTHPQHDRQRWYKTGDYCYQDLGGCFHYLGRIDNQCKIQGYRVELEEIEKYLREATQSQEVAVLAIPDSDNEGMQLIGVLSADLYPLDLKTLRAYLRQELPAYMIPERMLMIKHFPYNIHGKLDRQQLSKWAQEQL